ncbi:MAG TPA: hypothetical protein VK513_13395 [Terriglobales bacterium]|nr:hypothetical protein [Terriglobales bacterium]
MVTHAEHHRGIPLGGRNRSNKILVNLRKTAPRVSRFCPRLGLYTTTLLARTSADQGQSGIRRQVRAALFPVRNTRKEPGGLKELNARLREWVQNKVLIIDETG